MIPVLLVSLMPVAAAMQTHGSPKELIALGLKEVQSYTPWGGYEGITEIKMYSREYWISGGIYVLSLCLIWAVFGFIYKRFLSMDPQMSPYGSPDDVQGEFSTGLFDCCEKPKICLMGWCCLPVLFADTMRLAGLLSFWTALLVCLLLGPVFGLLGVGWLALGLFLFQKRRQLRREFDMEQDGASCAKDMLAVCCCTCCTVIQEHRHIEKAHEVGHPLAKEAFLDY